MQRAGPGQIGIGAHVSVAGGFPRAVERGEQEGLDAIQIFTSSPRGRNRREILPAEEQEYLQLLKKSRVRQTYIHTPYYVNASSPESRTWHFSQSYILREIELMDRIKAKYFVMHLGSHLGAGPEVGKQKVTRMLQEVLKKTPSSNVVICLENTAGQGNEVGSQLEDLGEVLNVFKGQARVGAVIDTCHIFSAGYDLRTPTAVEKTFAQVDRYVGWTRVPMLHFNDCKVELGGQRDRHEHIGKGKIGSEGMEAVVRSKYIRGKDLILETEPEGRGEDLAWLRSVVYGERRVARGVRA